MRRLRVDLIDKDYPYEEITELLHESYKEHLEEGRYFLAATQSVEETKRRIDGKLCVVCYDENEELVGTVTVNIIKKDPDAPRKWYEDSSYIYVEQMAVRPDYREYNVFSMMCLKFLRDKDIKKAGSWILDTSVNAETLVKAYVRMGCQIVDLVSWETNNYYSYILRKPISGRKYNNHYARLRFFFSQLICRIRFTEDGKKRF